MTKISKEQLMEDYQKLSSLRKNLLHNYSYFVGNINLFPFDKYKFGETLRNEIEKCDRRLNNIITLMRRA